MAEVFEAAWFFLPDIPPYAMCDDLRVLSGWALQHIPRQGVRARPLLVDNNSHLWFLNADGSLAAVSEDRGRSNHPSQWERYWRMREGIDAWHQPVHKPHPPGRKLHRPILVSTLTEADVRYLEWLEHNWDFVDGGEH
ncbi:MAG TPA: hypothetical protein PLS04_10470 [Mycobacterium sp.]|nr:MAG: hypothetical protein E6Q57_07655 [Mycobacterium sp.]HMZ14545.1 hypothetical protein [Mycobacterium sp.]